MLQKKYSQRRKKLWDSQLVWRQSSVILVWDWVEERNHKDDGELNLRSDDTDMTQSDSSQRNKVVLEVSGHWTLGSQVSFVLELRAEYLWVLFYVKCTKMEFRKINYYYIYTAQLVVHCSSVFSSTIPTYQRAPGENRLFNLSCPLLTISYWFILTAAYWLIWT